MGSKSDGLGRQSSLYNLTLDEVEIQLGDLGKPLCSMNLDELLNTVCTADMNLAQDLRKKTVDEVWQDIQQSHKKNNDNGYQEPMLGQMTLEDFLVKAGIVAGNQQNMNHQQAQWMQQQQSVYVNVTNQHPVQQSTGYPETQLMSNLSDTQTAGRKWVAASGDVMEKTVERRQKRMIKNRESAARSRARKQAYTNELENKISRLEEENERLKKQKAHVQDVGKVLPSAPPPKPRYQLRRTSSAAF